MRAVLVVAAAACALAASAAPAGATNECKGLQVCVPVIGPWVAAGSGAQVTFQLACPRRFVVAGLDAELSRRGVDVTFRGSLGSPVNPGITTSTSAEFLAREVAPGAPATFRPHIGCIPASGGSQRFPTSYAVVRPGPALVPTAVQIVVGPGTHRFVERCGKAKRLTGATHAVGFYTTSPPPPAIVRSVTVGQAIVAGAVHLVVHAVALPGVKAIVQVDMDCA